MTWFWKLCKNGGVGFHWINRLTIKCNYLHVHIRFISAKQQLYFSYNCLAVVARLRRETSRFHAPASRSRRAQRKNCLFLFRNLDTVFSDLTPENFANIWQIKWNWIRPSKFETARIHFLSDVFGLLSSRNLLPWQRDVTTSPLYFTIVFGSIKSCTNCWTFCGEPTTV